MCKCNIEMHLHNHFLPWKSNKYYTFWVYVCSLVYWACRVYALYYIVICDLSGSTIFFPIMCLGKNLLTIKCVLWFFTTFVLNSYHPKKNWARCYHKCSRHHVKCLLFMLDFNKTWMSLTDKKFSNIKLHENPSSGSQIVPWEWTNRHDKANSCFSQFCEHA